MKTKAHESNETGLSHIRWVLIIEDTEDLAGLLSEGLEKEGFRSQKVATQAEALSKLSRQKFECIILDLRLARGGDGTEIINAIRNEKASLNYQTPIIVASGYLNADVIQSIKKSVDQILVKPFHLSALIDAVNGAIATAEENKKKITALQSASRTESGLRMKTKIAA